MIGRLLRQSGVYTLANMALKAGGLVLLAFVLDPAYLSQADYGRHGLLETAASLLALVGGLGLGAGLLKLLADGEGSRVQTTAIAASLALGAAVAALVWVGAPALAAFLADGAAGSDRMLRPVRLMGVYAGLKVLGAAPLAALRAHERAGLYAAVLVGELALTIGGAVWLLQQGRGLEGIWTAYAAAAAVGTVALLAATLRPARPARPELARLVGLGAPLALAGLAGALLNSGDQYVLKAFAPAEEVGVYVLAAKFGGLINMLFVQSFNLAFAVFGIRALAAEAVAGGAGGFHRRVLRPYIVVTAWGVLGVSLLARDVTAALSPNPDFLRAEPLVLPISLGFLAYGVYFVMMNVLYARERTRSVAAFVLAAAALNLGLNLAAIPWLGAMGAALATLASYAALAAITARAAHRLAPQPYPWRAIAVAVALVVGLWGAAQLWAGPGGLGLRLALLAGYPPLVVACGAYRWSELRDGVARLRSQLRARREHGA